MLSYLLYVVFLRLYYLFIIAASFVNSKAKKWFEGRRHWRVKLNKDSSKFNHPIWVHAASLGEFEQGRNLIETLKKNNPKLQVILTFYSPSGYEIRKAYPYADFIYYLPFDFKRNVRDFIKTVQPCCALFIKYDFWYHYFSELQEKEIPLIMISSVFRENQVYFKPYAGILKRILCIPQFYFVQDKESGKTLKQAGILNYKVIPDTRIDRASTIAKEAKIKSFTEIQEFKDGKILLLAGSSYKTEESFLIQASVKYPELKIILVPHHVDKGNINRLKEELGTQAAFWSELKEDSTFIQKQFMVVDTIGILQYLYQYAEVAFVGGGFNKSIHNILEPATYGIPLLFGPNSHAKFNEAVDLLRLEGAFLVNNYEDFNQILERILTDLLFMKKAGDVCKQYIADNSGGTDQVINYLESNVLKTKNEL